jgi:3-phenylpropionate/trans-cinnamate dioxygenase ferredoxin reductase component
MADRRTFVIVGAGLAGAKAAEALRERGFDGRVVLVGDEQYRPYERPPLSKDFLLGKSGLDAAYVHDEAWYDANDVDLTLGTAATSVDRSGRSVKLADGRSVGFDRLLLATGSAPRRLPLTGSNAHGVHYLRRRDDAEAIAEALVPGRRLAVVGAGWIGLEVAAAARQRGLDVSVVEVAELPLLRVLGPEVARVFAELHRSNGVELHFGVTIDELTTRAGSVTGVRLADGTVLDADAVVVGVGAVPNLALAEDCGLAVQGGVLADASLRTSDPDVFAAGDIVAAEHPTLGVRVRVEHWANALNQPATAAAAMLGETVAYDELPYFYTDQFELGMEYVGYVPPDGYDDVVIRGDTSALEFIAFWRSGGRVLAGMNVNVWDVVDDIKAIVRSGAVIDSGPLSDRATPLADLLA